MTVLDAPYQEERQITALDGVAAATPEISYTRALNSIDTLSLYIRGEGPPAPGQITLDGAVGIYQDGFAVSRLQANTFDLLEPERIEVLAGPQGAAYGRDTPGGVINIVSRAPSGKLNFDQTVDFGNRDSYRILSALDTPRWHGLSAKISLLASAIDGYVKNQTANSHDYGSATQRAARLQLQWDSFSSFIAQYSVERGALDSTPEYDSNPTQNGQSLYSNYTYYADPNGPMRSTYRPINLPLSTANHTAQGLTVTWHVAPGLSVDSRTGYRTMNANEQQDYAELEGQPTGSIDLYNLRQFSQDLRTSGEVFSGQLRYTAGASYFKETGQHANNYLLLPYFSGLSLRGDQLEQISAETRSLAYYVQLAWRPAFLGRHIELAAGGRYTRDVKDAARSIIVDGTDETETGVTNHLSYGRATPEVSLTYDMTDGVSAYAKVSTAYEAGGALENAPGGAFATAVFRPETSTTYEVGLRSTAFGDRLSVKGAVFDSRRKDVQYALPVNLITADVLDFQRVTVWGAGFDVSVRPLRDLSLSASGTYLHWRIDQVEDLSGTTFDRNVFALPYTPRYSAAAAADYTFARLDRRELSAHLDYVYRARMFAEGGAGPAVPGNQFDTQPAYGLLNGRVTVSQETDWAHRVKFSVWGRNILNRRYYQPAMGSGVGVANLGDDKTATPAGYDARIGAWAEPRTYGIAIRYEY
jgi:iron complex outermembrane receptor protein